MDRQYPTESYRLDYRDAGLIHQDTAQLVASRAEWQQLGRSD
jgi:hypothetical protein